MVGENKTRDKMKPLVVLSILVFFVHAYAVEECPHEKAFCDNGWVIHNAENFQQILQEKLKEFTPQIGTDLVLDAAESYISDFSCDYYLIMWVVIWDRVSTPKDEMWGDVALSMTGPCSEEYTEIRWYDPVTKTKNIVCNPQHAFCLTTKIPLAYNTIF